MTQFNGTDGDDIFTGGNDDDIAFGNGGNDRLSGGGGNDILSGGPGIDQLTGGPGNDTFVDTAAGLNGDTITDLSVGDKIIISDADLASFRFSVWIVTQIAPGVSLGNTLYFSSSTGGGAINLTTVPGGHIFVSAASGGGVQLTWSHEAHNDFNGDGISDILWRSDGGLVTDWLASGNGFYGNAGNFLAQLDAGWQIAGTGDFNGDGRVDLLWRSASGQVTDWLANQNGSFSGNSGAFLAQVDASWKIAGTGDFNGDGFSDILWRSDSGLITEWLGTSNGYLFGTNSVTQLDPSWKVAGTGDFNGDGFDDILLRNTDGTVTDWLGQRGTGFVQNSVNFNTQVGNSWHIVGTGDFNGDGLADILWQSDSGQVTDWLATANGSFYGNASNFLNQTNARVVETGDFNGDGREDALFRSSDGTLVVWLGQANGNLVPMDNTNFQSHIDSSWHVQPQEVFL